VNIVTLLLFALVVPERSLPMRTPEEETPESTREAVPEAGADQLVEVTSPHWEDAESPLDVRFVVPKDQM
jgi:hypothetical protein